MLDAVILAAGEDGSTSHLLNFENFSKYRNVTRFERVWLLRCRIPSFLGAKMESLLERTRRLLSARHRKLTLTKINHDTGVGISWLSDLEAGVSRNPGVITVEILYNYLSEEPLFKK